VRAAPRQRRHQRGADAAGCAHRHTRSDDERPDGLPPTPAGAITLGLRNFTNEFKALAAYIRGDRAEEMLGQDGEAVRLAFPRLAFRFVTLL
jgi:hypothetical protein